MLRFVASLGLLANFLAVSADLRSDLQTQNVKASLPGDSDYDADSQAFNLRFEFHPAAVTFPNSAEEVSSVVKIGVAHGLQVVARSGGHSYVANGLGGKDGALVVDLRNLNKIAIDSSRGSASIGPGVRLGKVATTLANAGRALPHGTCPYVGFGGHAAFGGFGFASRLWGLTLDTITAIDLVLSNGTVVKATGQNYPDLFWALRGSAPSFGITTSVEVKTFQIPPSATIFQYVWNLNVQDATNALLAFQTYSLGNVPPELGIEIDLAKGSSSGKVNFSLQGVWYGGKTGLNNAISTLLANLPKNPRSQEVKQGTYMESVEHVAEGDPVDTDSQPDRTDTFYAKSLVTPQSQPMSQKAVNAFFSYLANRGYTSNTNWFCQVQLWGSGKSAVNSVAADATAFAHRSSLFTLQLYASAPDGSDSFPDTGLSFVDGIANSITSNSPADWPYGAYTNYIDDRLGDWQKRYYGDNYPRLRSLKAVFDPQSVFNFPTSVGQ